MGIWLLLISTFLLLAFALLTAARFGRPYMFSFSVGCILVSNITVVKQIGVPIAGYGEFTISLGVLIYSLVYLATDICSEYGDPNDAYRLAVCNLFAQVLFLFYIQLSIATPYQESIDTAGPSIAQLFATTPRITIAAILAALGAFVDIWIYERLKAKNPKGWPALVWRNNVSTILGQGVNTALFFSVAFYGVLENLGQVIVSAWLAKIAVAFVDTPFLILAGKVRPHEWSTGPTWSEPEANE